jgi:hypothetical protein
VAISKKGAGGRKLAGGWEGSRRGGKLVSGRCSEGGGAGLAAGGAKAIAGGGGEGSPSRLEINPGVEAAVGSEDGTVKGESLASPSREAKGLAGAAVEAAAINAGSRAAGSRIERGSSGDTGI